MLNYLWAGMILVGIIFAACTGRMPDVTNAAIDSSKEAITLCITMMGVMSFWVGLMEIATKAGIIKSVSKKMRPIIRFLFPRLPADHPAAEHITTNMIANEMCTFLIINISSLQLIPVNIIAYRSQYGSVNPAAIVGAAIVATSISTLAGIIYAKLMDRK